MAESTILLAALAASAAAGTAGTVVSVQGAKQQNKAVERSAAIAARNASIQQKALRDQQAIEREKRIREGQAIRGKLRVATAQSGLGFGGTYNALSRQLDADVSNSLSILDQNVNSQFLSIRSGAQADLASLSGQVRSPALEGLIGGLRTLQTGLSAYGALNTPTAATPTDTSVPADIPLYDPRTAIDPIGIF